MSGFVRLSEQTIKAREAAAEARRNKPLDEVVRDRKAERKAQEKLVLKNLLRGK